MATFRYFPQLPAEIRMVIWQLSASPRLVHISKNRRTACPLMQVCQEASRYAPYEEALGTWINFDFDMLWVDYDDFADGILEPCRPKIQRIRLTVGARDDMAHYEDFFDWGHTFLARYSLRELDLWIVHHSLTWASCYDNCSWPCMKENVRYIDSSGLVLTGAQMKMTSDWIGFHSWHNNLGSESTLEEVLSQLADSTRLQLRECQSIE